MFNFNIFHNYYFLKKGKKKKQGNKIIKEKLITLDNIIIY